MAHPSPLAEYTFPTLYTDLQLHTTSGTKSLLDVRVDGELEGSQGTNHEQTGTDTGVGSLNSKLLPDLDEAGGGALSGSAGGLVNFGQHSISRLGNDGGGKTGNQTGTQVGNGLHGWGHILLREDTEDGLRSTLVHDELGHSVRNLLEQDGPESGIEGADTLVLEDLSKAAQQTGRKLGLGDETDTGGLERAQCNVGEELSERGGGQVDSGTVLLSSLESLFSLHQ
jgi:hypothetical protein